MTCAADCWLGRKPSRPLLVHHTATSHKQPYGGFLAPSGILTPWQPLLQQKGPALQAASHEPPILQGADEPHCAAASRQSRQVCQPRSRWEDTQKAAGLAPHTSNPSHSAHHLWFPRLMSPQATQKVRHIAALPAHQIVLVLGLRPTLAEQSSEPLISRGGPLRRGQQLLTNASCSAIFLVCCPVSASQARTVLSGDADTSFSPSALQCSSRTAFLWPAWQGRGLEGQQRSWCEDLG